LAVSASAHKVSRIPGTLFAARVIPYQSSSKESLIPDQRAKELDLKSTFTRSLDRGISQVLSFI
jgi:hypothetical protein